MTGMRGADALIMKVTCVTFIVYLIDILHPLEKGHLVKMFCVYYIHWTLHHIQRQVNRLGVHLPHLREREGEREAERERVCQWCLVRVTGALNNKFNDVLCSLSLLWRIPEVTVNIVKLVKCSSDPH